MKVTGNNSRGCSEVEQKVLSPLTKMGSRTVAQKQERVPWSLSEAGVSKTLPKQ